MLYQVMMAAEKLACKSCGANLEIQSSSQYIRCSYCGAHKLVNRNRPARPTVPVPTRAQINYQPKGTTFRAWLPYLGLLTAAGGLMYFSSHLQDRAASFEDTAVDAAASGEEKERASDEISPFDQWRSDRPLLVDIDDDGQRDLVTSGLRTRVDDNLWVWAMSTKDWKRKWAFSLGPYSKISGHPRLLWHPESQSLLVGLGNSLRAYNIKDGSQRWQSHLSDKIEKIFSKEDTLWVLSADKTVQRLRVADAEVLPKASSIPKDAKKMREDDARETLRHQSRIQFPRLTFEGLRVESLLCDGQHLRQSPKRFFEWRCELPSEIAFALRRKGSKVPYLLRFDPQSKKAMWKIQLTPPGSLVTLDRSDPPHMELDGAGALYLGLRIDGEKQDLLRKISLRDGSTLWELPLNHNDSSRLQGMVADGDRVYLVVGGGLVVLSAQSGELIKLSGNHQKKLRGKEHPKSDGRWKVRRRRRRP